MLIVIKFFFLKKLVRNWILKNIYIEKKKKKKKKNKKKSPKVAHFSLKNLKKKTQNSSNSAQNSPKTAQNNSKSAQNRSKTSKNSSKPPKNSSFTPQNPYFRAGRTPAADRPCPVCAEFFSRFPPDPPRKTPRKTHFLANLSHFLPNLGYFELF
jgi:hypothetical protein